MVFYSCRWTEVNFFIVNSRRKIITEDNITNNPPNKDLKDGISPQIINPKKIAKTKPRYFNGVTKDTSENLYDWLNHRLAIPPKKPTKDKIKKSKYEGVFHPYGNVHKPAIVIAIEKFKEINQTGSVDESCLIAMAT